MENFDSQKFIKKYFGGRNLVPAFAVAFLTVIIIFILALAVAWNFRASLFQYFAQEYLKDLENKNSLGITAGENILAGQSVFSSERLVIDAVKKTNPAVVSIAITKEVPRYEAYIPKGGNQSTLQYLLKNFPGFNFNFPQYRQNGTETRELGSGSGFFVSSEGLIVTNRHVVIREDVDYTVFTNDGKKHEAKVVARDGVLDIALIKIAPVDGGEFPLLTLGNSDSLEVGQSVIAIGNALGEFRNTVSVGIISGLFRSIEAENRAGDTELLDRVIQTDAAINPGNSGGPLLDLSGRVVGVNVAIAEGGENIGFALPINSVRSAIESVKETGEINP